MKEVSLEEQKKMELDILKYVTEICDKNYLRYFLGGGTLLGAVRHNGFIPWDDDIDIMMPREDYCKLATLMRNLTHDRFIYLDYESCDGYFYPFAKVVDKRTRIIEKDCKLIEKLGVYIDVFPIDEVSDDYEENEKLFRKYKLYDFMLAAYKMKKPTKNNVFKLIIKYILKLYMNLFSNYKKIIKKIELLGKKYKNTNTVACISGRYFDKEIMPSSYIDTYKLQKFENYEFKIPVGYDEYLTKHYGNYMKLPPKEKQISNHSTEVYWR